MQLVSLKTALTTVWISAVLIVALAGNLNTVSSLALLASLAALPPIVLMWQWNAPDRSARVQQARR